MPNTSPRQPSREEIQAYIRQAASRYGIDPETFLKVVQSESDFNPAAVGDQGQSHGLAQLYSGGGLGNVYQQQTGQNPADPSGWMKQIDFMAQQAAQGKQGWGPWHGAANVGVGQFEGIPGQPGTVPHVATGQQRMPGPPQQMASNAYGGPDMAAWRDMWDPKGPQTLGALGVDSLMKLFGGPDRSGLRASERSHSLLGLGINYAMGKNEFDPAAAEKAKAAEEATKGYNPFSPLSQKDQLAALAKKPTLGSTLANYVLGAKKPTMPATAIPRKPTTVGSGLFNMFSGLFG